jgi:hypothetical protein
MDRLLWGRSQCRPDRIEIHVHTAGQETCLIGDGLGFKPSFPESAGALVFSIGKPCNRFGEGSHEPGRIRQTEPNLSHAACVSDERVDAALGGIPEEFIDPLAWKDTQPSPSDFVVGPLGNNIRAIAQDDVQMIGENRIGEDIDPEDRSKAFQTGPNPFSAVAVIPTRKRIISG